MNVAMERYRMLMALVLSAFLWSGCDPVPVQYPPGSYPYPPTYPTTAPSSRPSNPSSPSTQPSLQVTGSQRWEYAMKKAAQAAHMGGLMAGPFGGYGAWAGLFLGGIYGLVTADSHYEQLNAQIQTEQAKDKELEAKLEQEIERQRDLEVQLAKATEPQSTNQTKNEIGAKDAVKGNEKAVSLGKKGDMERPVLSRVRETAPAAPTIPFKNVEIKDVNQDGIPDLWIYYNPLKPGEIVRQEEDANGDGSVDAWSAFKDGKLVRREVDTKGEGKPDVVFYYENEKIAREERDESHSGQPGFRALYREGRLARVERDISGDGKMDLWITYDTSRAEEVIVKEERDLDSDGAVDLWSYYEGGRLVRRDVTAVGLEVLSRQGEIPSSVTEAQKIAPPESRP